MNDFKILIEELMRLFTMNFKVFGHNLNFLVIYISLFLIGLAVYAVRRLFF